MENLNIARVPGHIAGRSLGSAYAGTAFVVATASDKTADFAGQARQAFAKVDAVLAELGTSKARLLSVSVYLADLEDKGVFDELWSNWIGEDPAGWPQRCCLGVVLAPNTRVEIVGVAARPSPA